MSKMTVLRIDFDKSGVSNTIFPVLLRDKDELILVDCGYPGFLPEIKFVAEQNGIEIRCLTRIILTHHDYDHMGAAAEFKRAFPHIQIMASNEEAKYISGKEKSLRLRQAEALYDNLPDSQKQSALAFQQALEAVETVNVDRLLQDGQRFPWCGGVEIVTTPGHMPGHISIYLKESKTLIAGDALVIENGELACANPQYTLDMAEAKKSIGKLLTYEIDRIVCYHGGIFTGDSRVALQKVSL